ncbi:MAG: TlpA disulfide reductase family protein [Chloroflexota bacterium]|nr:TlpA disulfide reductase family protein [Chloroflexota bacterium]
MIKKNWIIDSGLAIIVLAMSAFVYFRLERMINFFRSNSEIPITQEGEDSEGVIQLTPTLDKVMPAFDFELMNLNGERDSLSDFYGKHMMVNFWAVRCPPCRGELPLIQTYAELYEDEFVVLAIYAEEENYVYNFF